MKDIRKRNISDKERVRKKGIYTVLYYDYVLLLCEGMEPCIVFIFHESSGWRKVATYSADGKFESHDRLSFTDWLGKARTQTH